MYSVVFIYIYIFFKGIFTTKCAVTYTIYESALNPSNLRVKIGGTFDLPTRDKSVEQPSFATENEAFRNIDSTANISRADSSSVEDTGKAFDKATSRESDFNEDVSDSVIKLDRVAPVSVREPGKILDNSKDSREKPSYEKHVLSTSAEETGHALDKVSSSEIKPNEDVRDSTSKLTHVVPDILRDTGKILFNTVSNENHSKGKKTKNDHVFSTSADDNSQALDQGSSREYNSLEDMDGSVTKLGRPGLRKVTTKPVDQKWIDSSYELPSTEKEKGRSLANESSKRNSSRNDLHHSKAKLRLAIYPKETDKIVDKNNLLDSSKVKEADQTLDKDSRENKSPEDLNDTLGKMRRPVYAKNSEDEDSNNWIDSSYESTSVANETDQVLDKDSKEDNSPEDSNHSNLSPVHAEKKVVKENKRTDSSYELPMMEDKNWLLHKYSLKENKFNDSTVNISRVVPVAVKEIDVTFAIENQYKANTRAQHNGFRGSKSSEKNHSSEDSDDSAAKSSRALATGTHKTKLATSRNPGVTYVSHNKKLRIVRDDKRIKKFTQDIYRQTLEAFEGMKETGDSNTRKQIDELVKSYKKKFADFVARTTETEIKTKEGARNVVAHIMETSNLMMDRMVNFLKENMLLTDELGPGGLRGGKLRLDQEVDAVKQLKYEQACKDFGVCLLSEGLRSVLLDLMSILIKLPNHRLVHINDAATETLKYMDLSKIANTETAHRIQKLIRSQERTTGDILKSSLLILYGSLSKTHLPLIVNKSVYFERPAVRQTISFHSFIDALEEALPPTEPNKREWAMTKDRLKRWAEGQTLDIQDILTAFFSNIINGMSRSKKMKQMIEDYASALG